MNIVYNNKKNITFQDKWFKQLSFEGAEEHTNKASNTRAVSYTHLDVYKRQGQNTVQLNKFNKDNYQNNKNNDNNNKTILTTSCKQFW